MKSLLCLLFALGLGCVARADDVAFICHPDLPVGHIPSADVKDILLGNLIKWPNGALLKLAVLAGGPTHEKVVRDFTQRTPDQFDKLWKKQVFTGKGTMPSAQATDAEMIEYVARTPGAVGYVAKSSVTPKVKLLTVD